MKKSYLVMAAAAALFAACSSDSLTMEEKQTPQPQTDTELAVSFDSYVNRGLTRSGVNGPIASTADLKKPATKGFGVFGYYTDGESYSGITKPNFFYNQQVLHQSGDTWYYTPVKYWPNEFGSDAKSDQVDRLTLFAYAPWVEVEPLTGIVTETGDAKVTNIVGMTRNTATGDPFIKYISTMDPTNSVDLCYGVAAEDFTSSNSAVNVNNIKKGKPYIDVKKPGLDGKIKFDFKHATAQLKVSIDAVVNAASGLANAVDANYTRIWVRSVTFEGVTQKGSLNLNGCEWYDVTGNSKITTGTMTVFDGRKDGKEALDVAANEAPATLNSAIVQNKEYTVVSNKIATTTPTGVTNSTINLFNGDLNAPVFVIPTGEKMKVTIVYDVETYDPNLAFYLSDGVTHGSTVENTITKTIDAFGNITAGYCYTLNLHLGMRTIDFEATITEWQDMQADPDLPSNLQTFAAKADPGAVGNLTLPAAATASYSFNVTGLTPGVKPTATTSTKVNGETLTANTANASGIAKIDVASVAANTTTSKKTGVWRVIEGSTWIDITVTQQAAPIGFSALTYATNTLTCTWSATDYNTMNAFQTAGTVKVYKNGTDITTSCDLTSTYVKTISVPAGSVSGDVYKVTLQANDAPMESRVVTVP